MDCCAMTVLSYCPQVVPYDASVACSSAVALEWCAEWKGKADPSGRAVAGVHDDAYGQ